jgi:RND family efflux transporter MFP subunit
MADDMKKPFRNTGEWLEMKKNLIRNSRRYLRLVALCLFVAVLAGCDDPAAETAAAPEPNRWRLPVMTVKVEDLPVGYVTTGSVVSDQRVQVSSRISGYIRKILVNEGDRVERGQELILLDDADVEGAIRQAQAAVNKAASALQDAQTDVKRYEELHKKGSVPENALRKMRLQRDVSRDSLREAQAALDTALAQRRYIRVTSSVGGVVVARHKREGDLATPGLPILTIESSQGLLFETHVAERRIAGIRPGQKVPVEIDALGELLEGTVARVVPAGDPLTRRYLVKIALPSHPGLLSGMFGRARFHLGDRAAPVIPPGALVERGGLQGVFVLDDERHTRFRWLQIGRAWNDRLEVLAGLQGGERIVATREERLREGDLIVAGNGADE